MYKLILDLGLKYLWEIIAVVCLVSALGLVYYKANHWCNKACRDYREEATELQGAIEAAQQRATDLALLWSKEVQNTERKYKYEYDQTLKLFSDLDQKGKGSASRRPALRVSPESNRVLNDASSAANAVASAPSGVSPEGAAPVPAPPEGDQATGVVISESDFVTSWIEAAKAYSSCKLAWKSCVDTYNTIRESSEVK
jgi:hypothetical protein